MSLPSSEEITEALRVVHDPEIGINIIDLGLVYDVDVRDPGLCDITMTLTAMGCPLSATIEADIVDALDGTPGLTDVNIHIVWSPPWNPSMMSDDAKIELGVGDGW